MEHENTYIEEYDSWSKVENKKGLIARKKIDKSFIKQGGSGIPRGLYNDFATISKINNDRLEIEIKLIYQGSVCKGNILRKKSGRVWINIKDDVIKKKLPQLFKQSMEYIEKQEPVLETTKKYVIVPDDRAEYVEFYETAEEDVYEMKFIIRGEEEVRDRDNGIIDIEAINQYLYSEGLRYSKTILSNFYLSLKSKPFVILAGISGTGKSKLIRLFAEAINAKFELIPVRPDWSDATELLGYKDINQVFHPGKLTQIIMEAKKNPDRPHIVCLDEMNLARVEYYFSDFLSLIESRHWDGEMIVTDCLANESISSGEPLFIPDNLYIVGTVNMDETTFQFSKKVLDRANTIELNEIDLTYNFEDEVEMEVEVAAMQLHNTALKSKYLILRDCKAYAELAQRVINQLITINEILKTCQMQFAYRVRDEIIFYMAYNEEYDLMSEEEAFDYQLLQKVLPRINGTSTCLYEVLKKLLAYCIGKEVNDQDSYSLEALEKEVATGLYPRSAIKLLDMLRRYDEDGFTSFWF